MSFRDLVARARRAAIAAFGEGEETPIVFTPPAGPAVSVDGIFSEVYVLAQGNSEGSVETIGPAVFLELADLPTDPEDDEDDAIRLTIRGEIYRVTERRPDGMGGIVLAVRLAG
jgi:hypothetical protein